MLRVALCCAASLALAGCGDLPSTVRGSPSTGLVFVRVVGESVDLARGRLADGDVRPLTRTPDRDETWPYWSELARRLVFQVGALNERSPSDLVLWIPNTGEEIALTKTPRRSERWPAWSPIRRQFVFAFYGPNDSGLALYDLDSDPATRLVARGTAEQMYLRPTFSPDGGRIVAQRRGPGGRGSDLWLLEEGKPPRPLTSGARWSDIKAFFTRDGRRIVFSRRPAGGQGWYEIDDVGVDGGKVREIAHSEHSDSHSARPSPTRDEIAFVSDRDGNFEIYLAASDGSDVRRLTNTPRDEFAPRWSPTGELLVVTVAEQEFGVPRLSNLESLRAARIAVLTRSGEVLFETSGFMPDWMPPW